MGDKKVIYWFWYKGYSKQICMDYKDEYLQLGFAPYVGDYNDLHTWIMLKTKKNTLTNKASTYPELKFFKGNALMKFGYGANTNWDLHFMYRF